MASSDVIREFLVSLGYKVDKGGQREFAAAVESSTAKVAALGTALVAAGTAVVGYTNRAAEYGEKLYWLSQRSKASAAGIEALGYAASQLGSSTDAAYGSIEAFGRFLQSAPGAKQWLERWIGPFENTEDALIKIGKRFKDAAPYFRNMVAQTLGLDYNFAQSLYSGEFEQRVTEERERAARAGIDRDKFAEEATQFKQAWREFWNELGLIGDRAAAELFTPLRDQFDAMTRFLDQHAAEWGAAIGNSVKEATKQIQSVFDTLGAVARSLDALSHGDYGGAAKGIGDALGQMFDVTPGGLTDKKTWESPDTLRDSLRGLLGLDKHPSGTKVSPEDAVKFFMGRGWAKEHSVGIVSRLNWESRGLNADAVGDGGNAYGLGQWHPDRQAAFARWSGHDIRQNPNAYEQLAFADWELRNTERAAGAKIRATSTYAAAGDAVSRFYERPRNVELEAARSAGLAEAMAVTLNQTNNITITGSGSPSETAWQVGRETGRQTETAMRQLGGAVR